MRQSVHKVTEIFSKAYIDILDRVADQEGLNYWVGQLESGQLAMDQFSLAFVRGVNAGSQDDQALAVKKVLGGYYSLVSGQTDVAHATAVFGALDEQTPGTSLEEIKEALGLVGRLAVASEQPGSSGLVFQAFETADAAVVLPADVATNRTAITSLIATNFFGLNAPAIAAAELSYEEMWAQDASAMFSCAAESVAAASALSLALGW